MPGHDTDTRWTLRACLAIYDHNDVSHLVLRRDTDGRWVLPGGTIDSPEVWDRLIRLVRTQTAIDPATLRCDPIGACAMATADAASVVFGWETAMPRHALPARDNLRWADVREIQQASAPTTMYPIGHQSLRFVAPVVGVAPTP